MIRKYPEIKTSNDLTVLLNITYWDFSEAINVSKSTELIFVVKVSLLKPAQLSNFLKIISYSCVYHIVLPTGGSPTGGSPTGKLPTGRRSTGNLFFSSAVDSFSTCVGKLSIFCR